jgi:hypothetical protein
VAPDIVVSLVAYLLTGVACFQQQAGNRKQEVNKYSYVKYTALAERYVLIYHIPNLKKRGDKVNKERAIACTNDELLDRLGDIVLAKLAQRTDCNCLLSSGSRVRVAPGTPASDQRLHYVES